MLHNKDFISESTLVLTLFSASNKQWRHNITYSIANVDVNALLQKAYDLLNLPCARSPQERGARVRLLTNKLQR